jgi:hypothetical protein
MAGERPESPPGLGAALAMTRPGENQINRDAINQGGAIDSSPGGQVWGAIGSDSAPKGATVRLAPTEPVPAERHHRESQHEHRQTKQRQ